MLSGLGKEACLINKIKVINIDMQKAQKKSSLMERFYLIFFSSYL